MLLPSPPENVARFSCKRFFESPETEGHRVKPKGAGREEKKNPPCPLKGWKARLDRETREGDMSGKRNK